MTTALTAAPTLAQEQRRLREALGRYATGVVVVSAATAEGPAGMAVNSFTSVSLDPPLIAFCPMRTSRSWARIRPEGGFAVSVLGEAHEDVARIMAGGGDDKFGVHAWTPGASGHPVLADALAWFDVTVDTIIDGGDHEVVIARVQEWSGRDGGHPLVFFGGRYRSLRDEP